MVAVCVKVAEGGVPCVVVGRVETFMCRDEVKLPRSGSTYMLFPWASEAIKCKVPCLS